MTVLHRPPSQPMTAIDRKLASAMGKLHKALMDDDAEVRTHAVVSVQRFAAPPVMDAIVKRLIQDVGSRDSRQRDKATLALQLLGPKAFRVST